MLSNAFSFETWLLRGTIFSLAAALIALCRPYKKTSANVSDTLLLLHLATICHLMSANQEFRFFVPLMQSIIIFPFVGLSFALSFRIVQKIRPFRSVKCFKCVKDSFSCLASVKVFATTEPSTLTEQERIVRPVNTYGSSDTKHMHVAITLLFSDNTCTCILGRTSYYYIAIT